MKRLLFGLALAVLAAGCSDVADNGGVSANGRTVKGSVALHEGTRISMGEYDAALWGYPLLWDKDDTFAVVNWTGSYGASGAAAPEAKLTRIDESGKRADFEVLLPGKREGEIWYAAYPYDVLGEYGDDVAYFTIPAVQTPTGITADPDAVILVSEACEPDADDRLSFSFWPVTAYVKITLDGLGTDGLESVALTVPGKEIAGGFGLVLSDWELIGLDAVDTITVDAANLVPDADGKFTVFMSLAPTVVDGEFTVEVRGRNGKTSTKRCDASENPLYLYEGGVTPFKVVMPAIADDAEIGTENTYYAVLAKYEGRYYALTAEESDSAEHLYAADVTSFYNGTATIKTDDKSIIWHFTPNDDGTYDLKNGDGYLGIGAKKSGAVFEQGVPTPLSVVSNSDGTYGIYYAADKNYLLAYNQNNPGNYWAFYKTSTGCIKDLYLVPTGSGEGPKVDGDDDAEDEGGDDNTGNENAAANVYRTGWPELPLEYDEAWDGRDDRNPSLYYAHHHCDGAEKNAQGGRARNYTVCYSADHHCPVWVAAPRHSLYETKGTNRTDAYKVDPLIPANIQYSSKDTGGGCNKGHMLGSAERLSSAATNRQVFYYTNIAPQYSANFNTGGGGWNTLEDWVDTKVCADTTYVVIGAYFDRYTDKRGYTGEPKKITFGSRNDVSCPTMFYYLILRTKKGNTGKSVKSCSKDELMCAAFVRAHDPEFPSGKKGVRIEVGRDDMMSVAELEALTGFTYFANVPNAPKETFDPSDWGL